MSELVLASHILRWIRGDFYPLQRTCGLKTSLAKHVVARIALILPLGRLSLRDGQVFSPGRDVPSEHSWEEAFYDFAITFLVLRARGVAGGTCRLIGGY